MQRGKLVEGDIRKGVVLGVVGHVPCQKADQAVGESGAGVLEHIRNRRTEPVLGQKVQPQKGLADQNRQQPKPPQQG